MGMVDFLTWWTLLLFSTRAHPPPLHPLPACHIKRWKTAGCILPYTPPILWEDLVSSPALVPNRWNWQETELVPGGSRAGIYWPSVLVPKTKMHSNVHCGKVSSRLPLTHLWVEGVVKRPGQPPAMGLALNKCGCGDYRHLKKVVGCGAATSK